MNKSSIIAHPLDIEYYGLLKDLLNTYDLENHPNNIQLIMMKDYCNGTLPEGYKYFKPTDESLPIKIDIPDVFIMQALKNYIESCKQK